MSKVAIDLKDFSHVKTENGKTYLQHKDGHELCISHDRLPEKYKVQLMAMGGSVGESGEHKAKMEGMKKGAQKGAPSLSEAWQNIKSGVSEVFEGQPQKKAEGGPIVVDPNFMPGSAQPQTYGQFIRAAADQPAMSPEQAAMAEQAAAFDIFKNPVKTLDADLAKSAGPIIPLPGNVSEFFPNQQEVANKFKAPQQQTVAEPSRGIAPPAIMPSNAAEASQQAPKASTPGIPGLAQVEAGINQEARLAGDLAKAQAGIQERALLQQQQAMATYDTKFKELETEQNALLEDYKNGHIDPDKYWTGDEKGNGSHSKIASAIGILLAGFNPTNQPNAAIQMLQYQMDKNMEAQSKNLQAKGNLLNYNMQKFGNMRDAMNATRMAQNEMIGHELSLAAAKLGGPQAQAQAQKAIGMLKLQNAELAQKLGASQTAKALGPAIANGQLDPSLAIRYMDKEHQGKAIEELSKVQESKQALQGLESAMQELNQEQTLGNRLKNPIQSASKIGALQTNVIAALKPVFGVLSESDKKQVEQNYIKLTDNAQTAQRKIKAIVDLVKNRSAVATPVFQMYGIDLNKVGQQPQASAQGPAAGGYQPKTFKPKGQ